MFKNSESVILQLEKWFESLSDVVMRTKTFKTKNAAFSFRLIYSPNLVDTKFINDVILPTIHSIINYEEHLTMENLSDVLEITNLENKTNMKQQIEQKLFSGDLLIVNEHTEEIFFISIPKVPKRNTEESTAETSIRGPRDGFVENISDNMALIRQRLKTTSLKSKEFTVGERSQTKLLLLYIEDIINPDILSEAQKRLKNIKIDIITSSYQIEELLYDTPFSILPLMDSTGRPDFAVRSLNQGRFVIIVEGNPTTIIGPTNLNQLLYSPEDDHSSFFYISFIRILRFLSLFTTITLPGFFIALTTHELEQIPYTLLATISVSRYGLPLSAAMEMLIMLTLFELFKEAGISLPKAVGQTVAVLGGLIIGDAAIRAGLTSPSMLVIVAITVISSYTLINQNIAGNIVLLRYFVIIFSAVLGMFGFFVSIFFIVTLVISLESFGYPYLSHFSNPIKSDLVKSVLKLPIMFIKKRNQAFQPIDIDRKKGK
jgi:Bacillus/Clostridium GerA spore germination protein